MGEHPSQKTFNKLQKIRFAERLTCCIWMKMLLSVAIWRLRYVMLFVYLFSVTFLHPLILVCFKSNCYLSGVLWEVLFIQFSVNFYFMLWVHLVFGVRRVQVQFLILVPMKIVLMKLCCQKNEREFLVSLWPDCTLLLYL